MVLDSKDGPLILHKENLSSEFAEGYRALLANISFSSAEAGVKTIAVTSATAGEGKTTTALNLGIVLAEAGSRVTLVEADLRQPRLYEALSRALGCATPEKPATGLARVLAGSARLEDVRTQTPLAHLVVVPAGPAPTSPSRLLGSPRMRTVLDQLSKSSDYVLIDTPPCIKYADALLIARIADGVLYVVRAGTQRSAQNVALKPLRRVGARMLGIVWNDAAMENGGQSQGRLRPLQRLRRFQPTRRQSSLLEERSPEQLRGRRRPDRRQGASRSSSAQGDGAY